MNDNCNLRATEKIMNGRHLVLLASVVMATACTDIDVENEPPVADAVLMTELTMGYIELTGETATVELSGAGSMDPDGTIVRYYWRRTDLTNAERFGIGDASMPQGDSFDPGDVMNPTLNLPRGSYRYSLWVVDDDGAVSVPASEEFQVGPEYMADAMCLETYPHTVPACEQCICAPSDGDPAGCYDAYALCFENADAMFSTLCGALVQCAIENECSGELCLETCPDEIMAASTYMGGTPILACSSGDPQMNPCAASSQTLASCTNTVCGDDCPAFPSM